jgi:surface carbohydrate biosynthesis protein
VTSKLNSIVYLPIEFGSREFDAKALLATVLASRGYSVAIGTQRTLLHYIKFLPPGIILFKSFNNFHHLSMRMGRKYHNKVVVLEEELLTHIEKRAIGNYCTKDIFTLVDEIYANSEHEKAVLAEFSGGAVPIHVTGNARVDLLKPKYRDFFKRNIDAVRARFGDFVLINTNFGTVNSMWGMERVKEVHVECGFVNPDDPESLKAWNDQVEFEHLNRAAMLTVIEELSRRRPNQKIVVRPHPNEALQHWDGVFDTPNISVVREGSHLPWTLASQLLLHTSCTTGFEAHVAGKVAMSLITKPNWITQSFISNRLNPVFTDPLEMADAADSYLNGGAVPSGTLSVAEAERYIWNIGDNAAVERLADLLTRDLPRPTGTVPFPRVPPSPISDEQKNKFGLTFQDCAGVFTRLIPIVGGERKLRFDDVGNNIYYLSPV